MIQPYKKGRGVSVMVWGAFYGKERANLVVMSRDQSSIRQGYSANSYIEVLDEAIPTLWEPGLLFMQDNAPIHKARKVIQWFEDHGIDVLVWPPYSPDLNPIEHLWFRLKQLVYEVRPDIEQVHGGVDAIQDALGDALERAWQLIDKDLLDDLVRSMERRVSAIIAAKGWYSKY